MNTCLSSPLDEISAHGLLHVSWSPVMLSPSSLTFAWDFFPSIPSSRKYLRNFLREERRGKALTMPSHIVNAPSTTKRSGDSPFSLSISPTVRRKPPKINKPPVLVRNRLRFRL